MSGFRFEHLRRYRVETTETAQCRSFEGVYNFELPLAGGLVGHEFMCEGGTAAEWYPVVLDEEIVSVVELGS